MPRSVNSKRQQRANDLARLAGFKNDYQYRKYRKNFSGNSSAPERMKLITKDRKRVRGEKLARMVRTHMQAFNPKKDESRIKELQGKYYFYVKETGQLTAHRFILIYAKLIHQLTQEHLPEDERSDWRSFNEELERDAEKSYDKYIKEGR